MYKLVKPRIQLVELTDTFVECLMLKVEKDGVDVGPTASNPFAIHDEEAKEQVVFVDIRNNTIIEQSMLATTTTSLTTLKNITINSSVVVPLTSINRRLLKKFQHNQTELLESFNEGVVEIIDNATADDYKIKPIITTMLDSEGFKEALTNVMEPILGSVSSGDLADFLKRYEGKKHILLTGEAGTGKTYEVDKYAKASGRKVYFKSLDNGTEVIDLLGHLIKLSDGNFAWKDGVVTKAFREASKGNKVILFLDELLRSPERELSILVGALTPNSKGKLVLNTGRALESTLDDGVIEEEVLEVDIENLWCVSTTNQGRGYHTGKIDRALSDRFRLFHKTISIPELEAIVTHNLTKTTYGKALTTSEVGIIIGQLKELSEAVLSHVNGDGKLKISISARHLSEVVETASNKKDIKKRLIELIPNITTYDSDGKPNPEQYELIKAYIQKFIKL
jgi:hypothetical protein